MIEWEDDISFNSLYFYKKKFLEWTSYEDENDNGDRMDMSYGKYISKKRAHDLIKKWKRCV